MERYRIHSGGALLYVTFSVVDWLPIFVSEAACKIVTESLVRAAEHWRYSSASYWASGGNIENDVPLGAVLR